MFGSEYAVNMHWELLGREPLAIQIHQATVVPAFFVGTWLIFFSAKGSRYHRVLGGLYLSLMTITAVAAAFIRCLRPGQLSWIHVFVPITLFGVASAIWRVRTGHTSSSGAPMFRLH